MEYLYHRVPKNMDGTILYPLNVLKHTHPEIYAEHVKKYEEREFLLEETIPTLECLWNDVLHFTAVSPSELKVHFAKAGLELPANARWYKVPTSMIQGENSTVFIYPKNAKPGQREYSFFDVGKMDIYRNVPEETIEYYKEMKAQGKQQLAFHLVPHILYKGSIETKDLEVVS